MGGPLEGVKVADFSQWGVGPFSGQLLGALGATVVKVDPPEGDGITFLPPRINAASTTYLCLNLYKENIRLDLKDPAGLQQAYQLIKNADVFLENLSPGTAKRLGLGYEEVSQHNPRIIYASATPFGRTGPMARCAAIDPIIQAFSGFCSITGSPGGRWEMLRVQGLLDLTTSVHIAMGVLQALILRQRDGQGRMVDVTMVGSAFKLQASRLAEFFATGEHPPLMGSAAATTAPHQAFQCQDKEWLMVAVTSEGQWHRFCHALERPELAGEDHFATNRDRVVQREELAGLLEEVFASRPYRWWEFRLTKYRVPHGRSLDFSTLRLHEEMKRYVPAVTHAKYGELHVGAIPIHYQRRPLSQPWLRVDPLGASASVEEALVSLAEKGA